MYPPYFQDENVFFHLSATKNDVCYCVTESNAFLFRPEPFSNIANTKRGNASVFFPGFLASAAYESSRHLKVAGGCSAGRTKQRERERERAKSNKVLRGNSGLCWAARVVSVPVVQCQRFSPCPIHHFRHLVRWFCSGRCPGRNMKWDGFSSRNSSLVRGRVVVS